jgi:hypothetical protein
MQPYPGSTQMPEIQRPPTPPSVGGAIRAMYAGAVASLIYAIIFLATLSTTTSNFRQRSPSLTASQASGLHQALMISGIVAGVLAIGLWILVARACSRGRGWARIVGTVLFAILTLDLLGGLAVPFAIPVKILAVVVWLAGLTAVVLLWRGSSRAFFARVSP